MALPDRARASDIAQSVRKLLLTSALVAGFSAYAAYQHFSGAADGPVVASQVDAATSPTLPARTSLGATQTPATGAATSAPNKPAATATRAPAVANAVPTRTPLPARPTATPTTAPAAVAGAFKDGSYVGNSTNAYYGNVQVKAVIKGGQLVDVQFVDYPHDRRTSQQINNYAMPYLQSEAIQAQSAQVDLISGATLTSQAYVRSLQSALVKAKS